MIIQIQKFLACAVIVFAVGQASAADSSAPKKPNIIFILGDDVGLGDIGCSGSDRYKTPNIDALAAGGTRFANAYTVSLCGPSRATIMTGRYLFRTGATNQDAVGKIKPTDEVLTPSMLKPAGYATSAIGKWSQFQLTPADFGFDDYLVFKGSGIFWNTQAKGKEYDLNRQMIPLKDKEYLPDLMHAHLVDFISKHHDDPFYVYYSMSHLHADILPTPDSAPDSKDLYADNIAYMDKLVGKLVAELDRQKLRENTLVIYFCDNGTANKYAETSTVGGRRLLGAKGSMQDGGNRVPMVVNWPGTVPAGKVSEDLIDSSDFYPTFAELAGAKLPAGVVIDGHSFAAQLKGEIGKPRDSIFIQLARNWYVLERGWKLNQAGELFNMSGAPWEEILVAADTQDPVALAARKRLQATLDRLNPAGGHLDQGDPSGRHASNIAKKNKKKDNKQEPTGEE
ncbi:MAG: sulfatase-like hydrolase/transferase [Akkermansiaceae bacterium]|nr:sulfatase-like hydrolase/transferase [Akkermansiaceae bacterium]MBJ7424137.1 sulfatase-like hydrolase/transferase [Akkermansiaceae bacterium]